MSRRARRGFAVATLLLALGIAAGRLAGRGVVEPATATERAPSPVSPEDRAQATGAPPGTLDPAPRRGPPTAPTPVVVDPAAIEGYDPEMTVHGHVLDEAGRPVAGAEVRGMMDGTGHEWGPPATTSTDGTFDVRVPNDDMAAVAVAREGFRPWSGSWSARYDAVVRLLREDRPRVRLRFTGCVPPDGAVRVLLARGADPLDPAGEAGEACEVRAGVAELPERLQPDTWRILVRREGGLAGLGTYRVPAGPGEVELPFELRPPRRLTVRVTDVAGAPACGVPVEVYSPVFLEARVWWRCRAVASAVTDASTGVARLDVLDLPPLRVRAGIRDGGEVAVPDGANEVRVAAVVVRRVVGQVLRPAGAPATDDAQAAGLVPVDVVFPGDLAPSLVEFARDDDPTAERLGVAIPGRDGRFEIALAPDGDLPVRIRLRVVEGLCRGPWQAVAVEGGAPPPDVLLAAPPVGEAIGGTVRDPGGVPVSGASIEVEDAGPRERRWLSLARTDAAGRFLLPAVPDGDWTLRAVDAYGERSAPCRVASGEGSVALVLPRPGRVAGRLVSRWNPLLVPFEVVALVEGEGPPIPRPACVGDSGEFTIDGSPSGRVRVFARSAHEVAVSAPFDLPSGGAANAGEMVLEAGAVLEGRAVTATGAPRANLGVVVCDPRTGCRRTVFTDLDGAFRADGLWEGGWRVGPAPLASPEEGVAVDLARGRTHEVRVVVP